MSGLELNKIAAAVLVAGLLAMVISKVTDVLYDPILTPEKRGYSVAGAETEQPGAAPAAEEKPVDITTFLASADPAKGEALAKPCTTCHTFEQGGANKVGPNLWGVVGNKHGHKEDFTYSKAMGEHPGTWGYQELSEFLTKPAKYLPGTKMAFAGLKKPEDRANILAYMNKMSGSPVAYPKPQAAPEEKAADTATDKEKADTAKNIGSPEKATADEKAKAKAGESGKTPGAKPVQADAQKSGATKTDEKPANGKK